MVRILAWPDHCTMHLVAMSAPHLVHHLTKIGLTVHMKVSWLALSLSHVVIDM